MVERYSLFLINIRHKKCVIMLLKIMLMHYNLFVIDIRLKKCVLKKCDYPSKIQFGLEYYKTQGICVSAINT